MNVTIRTGDISGTITAPASKSAMQRACATALIKGGQTILKNPGLSDDDKAALQIIQQLGATVTQAGEVVEITSKGIQPINDVINCNESGLSARMFTPIAALSGNPLTITGGGSLVKRPLQFFEEILPSLGVSVKSNNGFLPLQIKGPLVPADIEIDGSLSSQYLTGLLMAYAAAGASEKTIHVKNLNSKPYVDLTLNIMAEFGLNTPVHSDYTSFYFGRQSTSSFHNDRIQYKVESDWSGGAFLLVAAAIAGNISVKGLDLFSRQADKSVLHPLMQSGAFLSIDPERIEVRTNKLKPFHFNATDCPDLFPPLVALAAFCDGTSIIEGVHRLTHKESNRALTLKQEFEKMGVSIELQDDMMVVRTEKELVGALVDSNHDHRIAMACAVAALGARGETTIHHAEAVNKSYPAFWDHLSQLNADLSLNK